MVVHVGGKMYGSFVVEASQGGDQKNPSAGGKAGKADGQDAPQREGFFQAPIPNVKPVLQSPLLRIARRLVPQYAARSLTLTLTPVCTTENPSRQIPRGEEVRVQLTWYQPLSFYEGA